MSRTYGRNVCFKNMETTVVAAHMRKEIKNIYNEYLNFNCA